MLKKSFPFSPHHLSLLFHHPTLPEFGSTRKFGYFEKPLRGKKETKFANPRVNSFSANLPLFLAKIQVSPSGTLPPRFHGPSRVG